MTGVLTLVQLQDLFWGVTVTMTGLDGKFVRHAYQPNSQPFSEINQDCVYLFIAPVDDAYDEQRDITFLPNAADQTGQTAEQSIFYTRVIEAQWTFYGANGFDLADTVRNGILTESIRATMAASEVRPLTNVPAPTHLPESINNQWWERTDLKARFNVGTLRTATVPYLVAAQIDIYDEHGLERVIQVND